jgi:hypothetical protein
MARQAIPFWQQVWNLVLRRPPTFNSAELKAVQQWHEKYPGFNQPVVIPMCVARDALSMLQRFRAGEPPSRTPCYAAGDEDVMRDLAQAILDGTKYPWIWD